MQFREQAKRIQCLRSVYDAQTKRCRQQLVASVYRYIDRPPLEGLEALTEAERSEFEEWLRARQTRDQASRRRGQALTLSYTLRNLVDLVGDEEVMSAAIAEEMWQGLTTLSKALVKAGYPRPKRAAPPRAVPPGQRDLLDSDGGEAVKAP